MPDWSRASIPTLIQDARRLYVNAKDDPEIATRLDLFKVPVATLDQGLALIDAVEADSETLGAETVDSRQATGRVQRSTSALEDQFATDREMARTAYPRTADEYSALGLRGRIPDARAALLAAARDFYGTLRDRPDLIDPIPGITPENVPTRLAAVQNAQTADTTQAAEAGDVEVVSDERKANVAALRTHASTTARIANRALADKPQLREKLGLLERS